MKRILPVILCAVSTGAWAEWTRVTGSEEAITYVDSSTVHRDGNLVQMWTLFDFGITRQIGDEPSYSSAKSHWEFDCEREQYKLLTLFSYSDRMGRGQTVYADEEPTDWEPVLSESLTRHLLRIACGI